jgi:hypothetical protein
MTVSDMGGHSRSVVGVTPQASPQSEETDGEMVGLADIPSEMWPVTSMESLSTLPS